MSVNLSARQLLAPDLVANVQAATEAAGLQPSSLILELTESVLLADSERVLRRLHRLKDLGVHIAIDDFGTGYSSLSYLQRVPFDILKIDRAFVAALRTEDPQSTLVRTIMDLGRTLGRIAIAEGIEEQSRARRAPRCSAASSDRAALRRGSTGRGARGHPQPRAAPPDASGSSELAG